MYHLNLINFSDQEDQLSIGMKRKTSPDIEEEAEMFRIHPNSDLSTVRDTQNTQLSGEIIRMERGSIIRESIKSK